MKKIFFLLATFSLICPFILAGNQYEIDGLLYTIKSDKSVELVGLSDMELMKITIPSTVNIDGSIYSVSSIGENAFERSSINSIFIPASISDIGYKAFYYSQLNTIIIDDSRTPINIDQSTNVRAFPNHVDSVYIGRDINVTGYLSTPTVFSYIRSVVIGEFVTHVNSSIFGTLYLENVIIKEGLDEISDGLFSGARNLTHIELPSTIRRIGENAFRSTGLKDLILPNSVVYIGASAFAQNKSLQSIKLSENVDTIESSAFKECNSIKKITIPSSVKYLGESAFSDCTSMEYVDFQGSLSRINLKTFYNCAALTDIILPTDLEEIDEYAFCKCASLIFFEYPYSIKVVHSNALSYCDGIRKIVYNDNIEEIDAIGYEPYYSTKCCLDTVIVNFNSPLPVKKSYRSNIIVVVPHGCGNDFRNADYWKKNIIQEVDEDYVTVNVEQPGMLYSEINKQVSSTKVGKLKVIGKLDDNDWKILKSDKTPMLYSLDLSGISNTEIPKSQFSGKIWLTDILLPDSLEKINNNAFYGCTRLTGTLQLPETIINFGEYSMYGTNFDTVLFANDVSVGAHAFENCSSLEFISSEFITSIGLQAFNGCKSLKRFLTSEKLKSLATSAFSKCSSLSEVVLTEGLEMIKEYAFDGCSMLTDISFPLSLKNISYSVFRGCNSLTDFYAPWTTPIPFSFCLYGDEINLEGVILHVPSGTEGTYVLAKGWSHFQNIKSYDPTNVHTTHNGIEENDSYYDMYGRTFITHPSNRIYIHNGHKYIDLSVY